MFYTCRSIAKLASTCMVFRINFIFDNCHIFRISLFHFLHCSFECPCCACLSETHITFSLFQHLRYLPTPESPHIFLQLCQTLYCIGFKETFGKRTMSRSYSRLYKESSKSNIRVLGILSFLYFVRLVKSGKYYTSSHTLCSLPIHS